MKKNRLFFLLTLANFASAEPVWYNQKLEGWYYFQDGKEEGNRLAGLAPEEAYIILEEEKQKMQESLSLAVLAPTKENVENYASISNRWIKQSALFADAWGEVLEETPELELPNT